MKDLWKLKDTDILPIFGVCLGLQSLAIEYGGILKRLHTVKHGQRSKIHHNSQDIFSDAGEVNAVRYHSLHVELKEGLEVEELAWADDVENGKVTMGVRHKQKPFWAVQYHPESVWTEGGGLQVIANFWRLARAWSQAHGRIIRPWKSEIAETLGHPWPSSHIPSQLPPPCDTSKVIMAALRRRDISVVDICESFEVEDESTRFVLLDSAAQPGQFSIVGCPSPSSVQIRYSVGDQKVTLTKNGETTYQHLGSDDVWTWLAMFMKGKSTVEGDPRLPFWGGLIGFLSYELGVHSMHIPLHRHDNPKSTHPDVNLVFVDRSIVKNMATGEVFVQSIIPNDDLWVQQTTGMLEALPDNSPPIHTFATAHKPSISIPEKASYLSKIRKAQEYLFAGESYELCLTARTKVSITTPPSPQSTSWARYKRLREKNPAPHSAYLRLHPSTLLSSSPERFLSYSRGPQPICQLRPIKGTVRKAPHITRAVAEEALIGSTKEVAENLMIVDLIRHDLHGVVGEDVVVKQFCSVEEYETVWQLVSVIEGKPGHRNYISPQAHEHIGWQALKECLPPGMIFVSPLVCVMVAHLFHTGSMTGAPKKRSVEILQTLEDQERGIYSGVFGYWCVGGGGDWSVTIRSCFKYDDAPNVVSSDGLRREEWAMGAGGAITALSDPDAEWEEMVIKLQSVLNAFGALPPEGL